MTTRVPDGASAHDVDDVRAREAAHTRDLAAQGRVLRLWRPPLRPGEWRTIGLFAAGDPEDLERTLASMPLRVWRSDEVTVLGPHPDDPGRGTVPLEAARDEYLVTLVVAVPEGVSPETVDDRFFREASRARALAADGQLVRLWTLSSPNHRLGLWQAAGAGQLREILQCLPLAEWLTVETVPLTRHPSDPLSR
jgi:muconolactone delta-isomerase